MQSSIVTKLQDHPDGILGIRDTSHIAPRIIVPVSQQTALTWQTHIELLHQGPAKVEHVLKSFYYWPRMHEDIISTLKGCHECKRATVRRQQLLHQFEARSFDQLNAPRQAYGIDFYGIGGKQSGYILTAVDLCTRETYMWHTKTREQKSVAMCLLNDLISQRPRASPSHCSGAQHLPQY